MHYIAAFDISMGKSYLVIYNEKKECLKKQWVIHSKEGFDQLNQCFKAYLTYSDNRLDIIFEATGVYSKALERFLVTEGYIYSKMNPLEASYQSKTLRSNKNDKADAHSLALAQIKNENSIHIQSNDKYDYLKQLSRYYSEIESELSIVRGRLHSCIQVTFPELEELFTVKSSLFLNLAQIYPHPSLVLGDSKTIIKNKIVKNTRKNISLSRAENKAQEIITAAKNSYPAVDIYHPVIQQVKHYALRYQELLEQKKEITTSMQQLSEELPEYHILLSFPGIGINSAVRIIAELGDIRRFNTANQINAFVGIDIRRYQSGKFQMRDKINKRGNKELRKVFYLVITNMIRTKTVEENHIKNHYYRLKSEPMNKCHKVAVIATINKFIKTIFYLIKNNKMYSYNEALGI